MAEAIRVHVRYDTPNQKFPVEGEGMKMLTRREYYPRFQREAPPLEIPSGGEHLWEWYHDIAGQIRRIHDGHCGPIHPSEWLAWQKLTGEIVYPWEFEILRVMDVAFCDEVNKELGAKREADAEEARKSADRGKRGR